METMREDDEDTEQEISTAYARSAKMYAPKSLVLVSRFDYFDTFRVSAKGGGRGTQGECGEKGDREDGRIELLL